MLPIKPTAVDSKRELAAHATTAGNAKLLGVRQFDGDQDQEEPGDDVVLQARMFGLGKVRKLFGGTDLGSGSSGKPKVASQSFNDDFSAMPLNGGKQDLDNQYTQLPGSPDARSANNDWSASEGSSVDLLSSSNVRSVAEPVDKEGKGLFQSPLHSKGKKAGKKLQREQAQKLEAALRDLAKWGENGYRSRQPDLSSLSNDHQNLVYQYHYEFRLREGLRLREPGLSEEDLDARVKKRLANSRIKPSETIRF